MSQVLIHPTVGRVVWFYPATNTAEGGFARHADGGGPYAALVAHVWSDHLVNLSVFDANGTPHSRTSVAMLHDDEQAANSDSAFCMWMPFQKGQAKAQAVAATESKVYSDGTKATGPGPLPALSPAQQDASVEQLIQAKGKTAPRITPADLQANIASEWYFTAAQGARIGGTELHPLDLLTFCVLVLRNGFTVTGESACASPENFDAEIGRKIARQNAEQKIWPLMGYELKSRLSAP